MTTLAVSAQRAGGPPFVVSGVSWPGVVVVHERSRPAWEGSNRRSRLPGNWQALRAEAKRLNPQRICHVCGCPGGTTLDHKQAGDRICVSPMQHGVGCQCNLDWIHDRQDVTASRSKTNCHGSKTGAEGAAGRVPLHRPEEPHAAFR